MVETPINPSKNVVAYESNLSSKQMAALLLVGGIKSATLGHKVVDPQQGVVWIPPPCCPKVGAPTLCLGTHALSVVYPLLLPVWGLFHLVIGLHQWARAVFRHQTLLKALIVVMDPPAELRRTNRSYHEPAHTGTERSTDGPCLPRYTVLRSQRTPGFYLPAPTLQSQKESHDSMFRVFFPRKASWASWTPNIGMPKLSLVRASCTVCCS